MQSGTIRLCLVVLCCAGGSSNSGTKKLVQGCFWVSGKRRTHPGTTFWGTGTTPQETPTWPSRSFLKQRVSKARTHVRVRHYLGQKPMRVGVELFEIPNTQDPPPLRAGNQAPPQEPPNNLLSIGLFSDLWGLKGAGPGGNSRESSCPTPQSPRQWSMVEKTLSLLWALFSREPSEPGACEQWVVHGLVSCDLCSASKGSTGLQNVSLPHASKNEQKFTHETQTFLAPRRVGASCPCTGVYTKASRMWVGEGGMHQGCLELHLLAPNCTPILSHLCQGHTLNPRGFDGSRDRLSEEQHPQGR